MSVETLAVVLHHSRAQGTDKVVLLGIANHDGDGGAWPAIDTLAKYANVTARNAQKAVSRLVDAGEVAVHLNGGGTWKTHPMHRPNRYDVLVTCPPTCDGTTAHRDRPPMTAATLWTDPLSGATPPVGSDTPPVSVATPAPLSGATPEPYKQPSTTPGLSSVTGPRASDGDTPPCTECAAPDLTACLARQAKLRPVDRHAYTPRPWSS